MDYRNSDMRTAIDEHVHNERDREIMKRRLIDGVCYEPLAEEFGLSVRHVKTVVYKLTPIVFRFL